MRPSAWRVGSVVAVLLLGSCEWVSGAPAASVLPVLSEPGCALSSQEETAGFGSPDDPYRDEVLPWPTGDPAAEGLDPDLLAQIADNVGLSSTIGSFLVVRNGALVEERYYHTAGRIPRTTSTPRPRAC